MHQKAVIKLVILGIAIVIWLIRYYMRKKK